MEATKAISRNIALSIVVFLLLFNAAGQLRHAEGIEQ